LESEFPLDNECLENLSSIVAATKAKLVITSNRRRIKEERKRLLEKLKEYELDKVVIGDTPILEDGSRIDEVKAFLRQLNCKYNFIILDDDFGHADDLRPYLVQTTMETGLTKEIVEIAIARLNKKIEKEETVKKEDYER